jgi:hypothetical protein
MATLVVTQSGRAGQSEFYVYFRYGAVSGVSEMPQKAQISAVATGSRLTSWVEALGNIFAPAVLRQPDGAAFA